MNITGKQLLSCGPCKHVTKTALSLQGSMHVLVLVALSDDECHIGSQSSNNCHMTASWFQQAITDVTWHDKATSHITCHENATSHIAQHIKATNDVTWPDQGTVALRQLL